MTEFRDERVCVPLRLKSRDLHLQQLIQREFVGVVVLVP
jgi:hypothetical protein